MNLYTCVILVNQLKYPVQDLHKIKMFPNHYLQHNLDVSIQSKIIINDYKHFLKKLHS